MLSTQSCLGAERCASEPRCSCISPCSMEWQEWGNGESSDRVLVQFTPSRSEFSLYGFVSNVRRAELVEIDEMEDVGESPELIDDSDSENKDDYDIHSFYTDSSSDDSDVSEDIRTRSPTHRPGRQTHKAMLLVVTAIACLLSMIGKLFKHARLGVFFTDIGPRLKRLLATRYK
ncbi:hypothetical protein SARC_00938 [Sphaeroforma arctica JP610]|uniref:Uncharacterized protein n=1 Tax=Sphaeroforma arctica JP610 TaxID=667725 RepID=A0A0L0GDH5_9EUKA|nr:hypothetical protein SARC_00938 [Sphaeroforma arctica JP610]KNC86936.1 hypothetical protein SARC_00938 [Sphaeroforma arctica JP610]|eukprot:XP_014160838.1 hypothetical protein SARC_00938 [Sphaeroforma arctica JP610]